MQLRKYESQRHIMAWAWEIESITYTISTRKDCRERHAIFYDAQSCTYRCILNHNNGNILLYFCIFPSTLSLHFSGLNTSAGQCPQSMFAFHDREEQALGNWALAPNRVSVRAEGIRWACVCIAWRTVWGLAHYHGEQLVLDCKLSKSVASSPIFIRCTWLMNSLPKKKKEIRLPFATMPCYYQYSILTTIVIDGIIEDITIHES